MTHDCVLLYGVLGRPMCQVRMLYQYWYRYTKYVVPWLYVPAGTGYRCYQV
jgi:hypothetical protein